LYKKDIYHSDIKAPNIAFCREYDKLDLYIPKLIDLGGAAIGYNKLAAHSKFYFFNKKNRKSLAELSFNNAEERLKVDLYSLSIIALQIILLSQRI
jgi:hypothetical protein